MGTSMTLREWIFQDWSVNAARPECQLLLAWFRLSQWTAARWGKCGLLLAKPYWLISSLFLGYEIPVDVTIGPRFRLYHKNGIVLNPNCVIGSDCHMRHGVTIGNKVDRKFRDLGTPILGDNVDLGAGCVIIGDIRVGDNARIGALTVVTKPVPAWGIVAGNPGRIIRVDAPEPSGVGEVRSFSE